MNHVMRKVLGIAALVFSLIGIRPVAAQSVDFLKLCAEGTLEQINNELKDETKVRINAKDEQGRTTLMYAAKNNADPAVMKVLLDAAVAFNRDLENYFQPKVDVNAGDKSGKTALMFAVENNSSDVVQILLEAGADITVKDINLAKKRKSNAQEVVAMLRKAQKARSDRDFLRLCAEGTVFHL